MAIPHVDHRPLRPLFIGGGVATLEALAALQAWAPGLLAPVVVSASEFYVDRPMAVAAPFGYGSPRRFAMDELCASLGAVHLRDSVAEVDVKGHVVRTTAGDPLPYDVLVVATGAQPVPAFEHGVTFDRETAPEDFDEVLVDVRDGFAPRIALVVPDDVQWTMAAYELALMAAGHLRARFNERPLITLVTHERTPLSGFGATASAEVRRRLDEARIVFCGGVHPDVLSATALRAGGRWIPCDRVVALPQLTGRRIRGLPAGPRGFLATDRDGYVASAADVLAAGDITDHPIKQGGLAAQQGVRVAATIVRRAGVEPPPLTSGLVLRGMLRTPDGPLFLRAELDDVEGTSAVSQDPLWWPPAKIATRWLTAHLQDLESGRAGAHVPAPRR